MSDLTPHLIKITREECSVRINNDGTLVLVFKDGTGVAMGYDWVMEELCRRTIEAAPR
jgi:hypothetical protein